MPLSDDEHCPGEASPTETLMAIAQAVNTADCSREVRRRVNALVDQASAELAEAYRCGVMHERTGYVRDERDQPAQSIDDVERAAKWILANVVTTSVTVVTAEMSLAAEFAAVRAETAQKFLRSEAAKPDNYAGDPGKWSCLCGKTQRTCPCFLRGCEVGAANATEPRTAEDQPAVEHVAIVVSAARDLIGYLGTTGKDRDLTPSHDRYVRTLRGALNVLESRRERASKGVEDGVSVTGVDGGSEAAERVLREHDPRPSPGAGGGAVRDARAGAGDGGTHAGRMGASGKRAGGVRGVGDVPGGAAFFGATFAHPSPSPSPSGVTRNAGETERRNARPVAVGDLVRHPCGYVGRVLSLGSHEAWVSLEPRQVNEPGEQFWKLSVLTCVPASPSSRKAEESIKAGDFVRIRNGGGRGRVIRVQCLIQSDQGGHVCEDIENVTRLPSLFTSDPKVKP